MKRDDWRAICSRELGKPYLWGAEGPEAYDCSGFAQFALRQLNLDPPGDQTAAGLYRYFSGGRATSVTVGEADLGDLVFFGTEESITHVGLAWGGEQMIEAGGGGRRTTTVAIARRQNAEVRITSIARRRDLVGILRPTALAWDAAAFPKAVTESLGGYGHFTNAPPLAEWLEDGRHMRLKRAFGYVEEGGREWPVPAEVVVDGASIPQVFWSLIGGPFSGPYRDASIVHDHYCDVRTRPWEDTHRVFYGAMRCSGVDKPRAKVMYYAVYRFGPRWTFGPSAVAEGFEMAETPAVIATSLPVEPFDLASFQADASLIRSEDPDLTSIEELANARGAGGDVAVEASAAFARRPLLERLVAMQDTAADASTAQGVGALLARHTGHVLTRTPEALPESRMSFADLKSGYEQLYASCSIRPERAGEVAWHRKKLLQYRPRYEAVSVRTRVPWWFIGVVHALEGSFNFHGHLHNGDPLSSRTVQVPKDRPAVWNPPNDWESSAVDALVFKGFDDQADWSLAMTLYRWESYNGFGYYSRGINSPYLWSFSDHYSKGKFVGDGKYDPNAVSKQCGAAVMLKTLEAEGIMDGI